MSKPSLNFSELRIITGVNPSGSVHLIDPFKNGTGQSSDMFLSKINVGDWVLVLGKEDVPACPTGRKDWVKVLTKNGVGFISEWILVKNSEHIDTPSPQEDRRLGHGPTGTCLREPGP